MKQIEISDEIYDQFSKRAENKGSKIDEYIEFILKQIAEKFDTKKEEELTFDERVQKGMDAIAESLKQFSEDECAIAFTGGKDSIVVLDMIRKHFKGKVPLKCIFIQESHFDEIYKFMDEIKEKWGLDIHTFADEEALEEYHKTDDIERKKHLARMLKITALKKANQLFRY